MMIDAEQKFLDRKFVKQNFKIFSSNFISSSHAQAVAAKAARQKDHQQNFGSKTRYDNLNTNQV